MREIKFRAWNANEKKMVTPCLWINECNLPSSQMCSAPTHPIMQFTGAYDEQGEEIWEGDIYWNGDGDYWPCVVVYAEKTGAFVSESADGAQDDFYTLQYDSFVKVGNIHENPELLEDLK